MPTKIFKPTIWLFTLSLFLCPSPAWAISPTGEKILLGLLLASFSLLSIWVATVFMLFGWSFLQGFLAGFIFILLSYIIAIPFVELIEPRKDTYERQTAPKIDPLKGMNLS